MTNSKTPERPSMKRHRQQRLWQIIFPIILISLFIFLVGGYFVFGEGSHTRVLADISIIWIVLPLLAIFLIAFALVIGMIYLLYRVNLRAPIFTHRLQKLISSIQQKLLGFADSTVKPVIWINQSKAGIVSIFRKKKSQQ